MAAHKEAGAQWAKHLSQSKPAGGSGHQYNVQHDRLGSQCTKLHCFNEGGEEGGGGSGAELIIQVERLPGGAAASHTEDTTAEAGKQTEPESLEQRGKVMQTVHFLTETLTPTLYVIRESCSQWDAGLRGSGFGVGVETNHSLANGWRFN